MPPLPFGPVCTLTWMFGLAWFQMSTTFWMSGTQEVKFSVTVPLDGAQPAAVAVEESPEDEDDEFDEQAVIERVDKSRIARVRRMSAPDFT